MSRSECLVVSCLSGGNVSEGWGKEEPIKATVVTARLPEKTLGHICDALILPMTKPMALKR